MGNYIHNLQLIKCALEGLKRLDDWEDSEEKKQLIHTRESMSVRHNEIKSIRNHDIRHFASRYMDPWGKEITLFEWSVLTESCSRHIGQNLFQFGENEVHVSTTWLGLNHGWGDRIQIFETMIFGIEDDEDLNGFQKRYSTINEALEGHISACEMVKNYIDKKMIRTDGK